jgi:hypothetical protein
MLLLTFVLKVIFGLVVVVLFYDYFLVRFDGVIEVRLFDVEVLVLRGESEVKDFLGVKFVFVFVV